MTSGGNRGQHRGQMATVTYVEPGVGPMQLTEESIQLFAPESKPRKHFDALGLFLLVQPNGQKLWRMKYRFGGKEKQLSFGIYPEISLNEARSRLSENRAYLREGVDPSQVAKDKKALAALERDRGNSPTQYMIDHEGTVTVRFGRRVFKLTPGEADELGRFLNATSSVGKRGE